MTTSDPACDMAHGDLAPETEPRTLVAVFAAPVSAYLMHFGRHLGFHTVLVEPDQSRVTDDMIAHADGVATTVDPSFADGSADVVMCDHDRSELGEILSDALAYPPRWIGVMGSPRHSAPHIEALRQLGVPEESIALVHRPIGLNIGSHTPAEIAVSTLAGLVADRNGRPGGTSWG